MRSNNVGEPRDDPSRWAPTDWISAVSLLLLIAFVNGPVITHGYITLDDPFLVSENDAVAAGLSWEGIGWALSTTHAANWMPLTWISYLVDETVHSRSAAGTHAFQLLLHALSTLVLFAAVRRLTRTTTVAAVTAAVFAVHPLGVEVVAWASERKGALSGVFFILALWTYAGAGGEAPSRPRRLGLAGCMLGSLLAKPVAVTLPLVLLLLDYWPLRRLTTNSGSIDLRALRQCLYEKTPLFLLSAAGCAVALLAQGRAGTVVAADVLGVSDRLVHVAVAYGAYLRSFVWPAELAVYYPLQPEPPLGTAAFCAVVGVGISALALIARRRFPWLLVGWLWFVVTLIPMIGLVQIGGQARADRYMYLPGIGLTLSIAWTLHAVSRRYKRPMVGYLLCGAAVAALAIAGSYQRSLWKDGVTLFSHTLEISGSHTIVHEHLGLALLGARRVEEGRQQLALAIASRPRSSPALVNNIAWSYATDPLPQLRDPERALALARSNVVRTGAMPELLDTLAAAYASAGRFDEATKTQIAAVEGAEANGRGVLAELLRSRLRLYQAGRPFIDREQNWVGP